MPRLYNVDHQPLVVHNHLPAVLPGESCEFSDEQVKAGIAGLWSKENPNAAVVERAAKHTFSTTPEPVSEPESDKEE